MWPVFLPMSAMWAGYSSGAAGNCAVTWRTGRPGRVLGPCRTVWLLARLRRRCPAVAEPHFDFDKLDTYVGTINRPNDAGLNWSGSHAIAPLVVTYEELVADMTATTGCILPFLGLDLPIGFTRRLSDEVNRQWVRRYRAARSAEL